MMPYEIAHKYSTALLELAREQDRLISMREELEDVLNEIREHGELEETLFHPLILPEDKKRIIEKVFGGEISETLLNFLRVLIGKRREYFLESIISEFKEMVVREENILEVEVTTAVELKESLQEKLKSKLEQMLDYKIIIKQKQEPDIIGGLILKIEDNIIDGSIRKRMESLRERIKQIPVSELGV